MVDSVYFDDYLFTLFPPNKP